MLIGFQPWHVREFVNRENGQVGISPTEHNGPAYTVIDDDGQILGCSGVTMDILPGVGIAWFAGSKKLLEKYPVWATRQIRIKLVEIIDTYKLKEINASVDSSHRLTEVFQRWIKVLGFEERSRSIIYVRNK
jgi:hypothetical protein